MADGEDPHFRQRASVSMQLVLLNMADHLNLKF
jgi:hypothetical protein